MLLALLLFTLSTVVLFLSSQAVLSRLFHLTRNINLVFFLLLPGIFLHEFSHILMAELLQVPTGELKLKPQIKDGHLSLGSAQIAATDPFRLTLIGLAPFISGLTTLWLLFYFRSNLPAYLLPLIYYLVFAFANTLFSSASDLQAAAVPLILILVLLGIFQLTSLSLPAQVLAYLIQFFFSLTKVFSLTLMINLVLLLPLALIHKKLG